MHEIEGKWQRRIFATAGMLASLLLLTASGFANWRYGCSLGRSWWDCQIYGAASAAGDVFMALSPFYFFAAVKNRELVRALAAVGVWVIMTGFAFTAATSHASLNRLDSAGKREVAATSYQDIRADISQARKDRGFVPTHRPEATVRAEVEKLKTERLWHVTEECQSIAGKAQRDLCSRYQSLNSELGYAMQATKLDGRIDALTQRMDKAATGDHAGEGESDPGARTISLLTGTDMRTTQGLLIAGTVLMILVGAGLGPYVSMSMFPMGNGSRIIDANPVDRTPSAPPPQPLPASAMKALPAPVANPAGGPPPATLEVPPRTPTVAAAVNSAGQGRVQGQWQLLPGAEDSLRSMGFPVDGRMAGRPLRPRLKGKDLGLKFCTWAQAGGLHGDNRHADDDIDRLNLEFSRAYHCQQAPHKDLKEALDSLVSNKLVYKSRPVQPDGTRPVRWSIKPGKYPKADPKQQAQPDTESAKEGRLIRPPFGDALLGPDHGTWQPLQHHLEMKARHLERINRTACHKQRWAQANRRAA